MIHWEILSRSRPEEEGLQAYLCKPTFADRPAEVRLLGYRGLLLWERSLRPIPQQA